MSDIFSDLRSIPLNKCPTNFVVNFYEKYAHDLDDVLDIHAQLQ